VASTSTRRAGHPRRERHFCSTTRAALSGDLPSRRSRKSATNSTSGCFLRQYQLAKTCPGAARAAQSRVARGAPWPARRLPSRSAAAADLAAGWAHLALLRFSRRSPIISSKRCVRAWFINDVGLGYLTLDPQTRTPPAAKRSALPFRGSRIWWHAVRSDERVLACTRGCWTAPGTAAETPGCTVCSAFPRAARGRGRSPDSGRLVVEQEVALARRDVLPRRVEVDATGSRRLTQQAPPAFVAGFGPGIPARRWRETPRIRHNQCLVVLQHGPKPLQPGQAPRGFIKGKEGGREQRRGTATRRAAGCSENRLRFAVVDGQGHPFTFTECRRNRVGQSAPILSQPHRCDRR